MSNINDVQSCLNLAELKEIKKLSKNLKSLTLKTNKNGATISFPEGLEDTPLGNVHKESPTILGHFGHTYLPMSDVFYYLSPIFAEIPIYPKIGRPS